jgi:ribulose-phosphate 3-epimerase
VRPKAIIAPSVLSADFTRLGEEIAAVEKAGADWIHLDVMDGHFVPNLTFGPPVIKALRKTTKLPFDVHLMIEKPEDSIGQYADAGASHLLVHPEASVHLHRTLNRIRELGCSPGVVLNPSSTVASIVHVLHMVDQVLVMTVNPGFGGQSFIAEMLAKIEALRDLIDGRGLKCRISVDGGIDAKNAARVAAVGASAFVAGSAIFGHDYAAVISAMRQAADEAKPTASKTPLGLA